MTTPSDVEGLLATLLQLGVNEALVAKAGEILSHRAEEIDEWIELAAALRERQEYDAALVTYDAAIQRFPDSHVLWSNRGVLFLAWELYEEALKSFSKALEIKPDYVNALANTAAAHERLHEFDRAIAGYRQVLALEPGHARAWNSLGVCLYAQGDEEGAIRCYEQSTRTDPSFTDPLYNLAALYSTRREYSKALHYVSRLLEVDPDDYHAIELKDEILEQPEVPRGMSVQDTYHTRADPASAGRTSWRDILYRADGTRRPDAEIVAELGEIGLRLALLEDEMHRRADADETRVIYPLRLFLSYKWGTEAENEWVATLAFKLAERGWDVVFDRYRDEAVDRSVESFVSRIAACHVFLAVATPSYVAHGIHPRQPSWVFDEYQVAMSTESGMYRIALAPEGKLFVPEGEDRIYRRSDTVDPAQFGVPAIVIQENKNPLFDEIYAIPADEDLDAFLDEHFVYDGPGLDDHSRSQIVQTLDEIQSAGQAPDVVVGRLREILARYPFVFAAWRALVLLLTGAGRLSQAADALEAGIQHVHPWDNRLMLERERVDLLQQLGRPVDAVKAALQILETRPRDWVAHFYTGNRLDDCDELWAARNHLLIACNNEHAAAEAWNTLGVVYLGLGFLLRARQCFEGALQRDATLERAKRNLTRTLEAQAPHNFANVIEIQGPGLGCTVCPAIYPVTQELPVLCAACGGRRPASGTCPYCGHDGMVFWSDELSGLASILCPTCRIGSLTKKSRFDL